MLWSLLVSAYVIYLYRKLNAEENLEAPTRGESGMSATEAELAKLSERIAALEGRLSSAEARGAAS